MAKKKSPETPAVAVEEAQAAPQPPQPVAQATDEATAASSPAPTVVVAEKPHFGPLKLPSAPFWVVLIAGIAATL